MAVAAILAVFAAGSPSPAHSQTSPACDDGVDNDHDGAVDWLDDASCGFDPAAASEGPPVLCADTVDNDGDGAVDRDDPGCHGRAPDFDETDPAPVASTFRFTRARFYACGIETAVEVLPDLAPARLFPFGDVTVEVRGRSGKARGIRRKRSLPLARDPGYAFQHLKPGNYHVIGRYPGDRFRLASPTARRRITIPTSRCRVYVSGSGYRRYKPSIVYFGASQRIYDIQWRRWGGRRARGIGTYPVNDCIPYCAAGSITPYPVTVKLSRRRICNGFRQYLTMRRTYRGRAPEGSPRTERIDFDYICR